MYIKLLGKIFSLGPDEAWSNLSKACLSYQKIVLLLREHIDSYRNRMRNLHLHIRTECGEESKEIFLSMGKNTVKMADRFQNHRHFTLRCLGEKVVPVSIKLKSHVKTPKGLQIIRRAEISLLNERIRLINNTINMLRLEKDTCIRKLKEKLGEDLMAECENFIEKRSQTLQDHVQAKDESRGLVPKK